MLMALITRQKLTRSFLLAQRTGAYIVSNCYQSASESCFAEFVAGPNQRADQWQRIKLAGADGRTCNVYDRPEDHEKWEHAMDWLDGMRRSGPRKTDISSSLRRRPSSLDGAEGAPAMSEPRQGETGVAMRIYTIGYGGRTPNELISLLKSKQMKAVVDVRLRPDRASLGYYAKARDQNSGIERLIRNAGIEYFSFIELGNLFLGLPDWADRYRRLFEEAGELLIERLSQVPQPFCLMCAEKRAAECHRKIIAEHLATRGHEVEHIE
jgi:hypothetical protein